MPVCSRSGSFGTNPSLAVSLVCMEELRQMEEGLPLLVQERLSPFPVYDGGQLEFSVEEHIVALQKPMLQHKWSAIEVGDYR